VVYGHGASVLGYARARTRGALCPLLFNPHGLEEFGGPGQSLAKSVGYAPLRAAARYCARAADRVISTDRCLVPVIGRHLRVPEGRVRVVPNAVDLERATRRQRTSRLPRFAPGSPRRPVRW